MEEEEIISPEMDLSFIKDPKTRALAQDCLTRAAHAQNILEETLTQMRIQDAILAAARAQVEHETLSPIQQLKKRWAHSTYVVPEDLSPEAVQKRFEEDWGL